MDVIQKIWRRRAGNAVAGVIAAVAVALGLAIGPAGAASTTLVINEVMAGDSHGGTHEFVEVRNISNEDFHADLYELRYQGTSVSSGNPSSTVTTFYTFPVGTIIPAGGYYLVVSDVYAAHVAHQDDARNGVYPGALGLLGTHGGVGLFDASGNRVDSVAWGVSPPTHPMTETEAIAQILSNGITIQRVDLNGSSQDTDNNSMDFEVPLEPSPTSTPYVPNVPLVSVTVDPPRFDPGETAQVRVSATPTVDPVSTVTLDLTAFGGASDAPLTLDTGGEWIGSFTVPAGQASGPYVLIVRANDTAGRYGTGGADVFVYPGPPITVAEAKARTANTDELVRVRGVVMAASTGYGYITDPGVNGGIAITDGNVRDSVEPLEVGQDVTITGYITQDVWYSSSDPTLVIHQGEYRVVTATGSPDDIVVHSTGNPIPAPRVSTLDEIANDISLVGQLVSVNGVIASDTSTRVNGTTGENIPLIRLVGPPSTWIAVSRSASDKAVTPYPDVPQKPIPIPADPSGSLLLPWVVANDTFNVRAVVGVTSVGINTTTGLISPRALRVGNATDFVLTSGAKFIEAGVSPAPAEQGRTARVRVVGYPVDTAVVTVDLSALGLGTVALPSDGVGGYAANIVIPSDAPLGEVTAPVSVAANGETVGGSVTFTVGVPTSNPGDVDGSGGAPTLQDVALALRVGAGLADGATVVIENGDVYPKDAPDGALALDDALRILRAVNGLDTL